MVETQESIARRLADDGVTYMLAQWVDIHGTPRCKGVPASALDQFLGGSAGFAGAATVGMGQGPHDHDLIGMPDLATYTLVPWETGLARFACDIEVDGEPWPYCSRTALRRQIERLAGVGYSMKVGVEAEHMLVTRAPDGSIAPFDPSGVDTLQKPCYDFKSLAGQPRLPAHARGLPRAARLGAVRLRSRGRDRAVRDQLEVRGRARDGRPLHVLQDDDQPGGPAVRRHRDAHAQAVQPPDRQRQPLPLLAVGRRQERLPRRVGPPRTRASRSSPTTSWAGCWPMHARSRRSSRRPSTATSGSRSGRTSRAPAPGSRGRRRSSPTATTTGPRCSGRPSPGRFECRVVSGAVNPYLGMAGFIAAGIDGIERGLDPGDPQIGRNMYETPLEEARREGLRFLPQTLSEALDEFERDEVVQGRWVRSSPPSSCGSSGPSGSATTTTSAAGRSTST